MVLGIISPFLDWFLVGEVPVGPSCSSVVLFLNDCCVCLHLITEFEVPTINL